MTKEQYNDLIIAWETSNRVTEFFIENIPDDLWSLKIPGMPQKTIRMLAGHIHNARCMWIKMIGKQYGVKAPKSVDRHRVTQNALLKAIENSNQQMIKLLNESLQHRGMLKMDIPWSNIPSDVFHFMTYIVAHEAHHRGQIILAARQMGQRLPKSVTDGLWQWRMRNKESKRKSKTGTS